jgi:acetylornithine aminotransferase/acetylornithine/N-succinyldiaminopimelate aminotransferase
VRFVPPNDSGALEQVFSERTAGIVIEGIQGEGGIYPVSEDFMRTARALCDRYDALLVADEIQCGVGRPGVYFSYQLLDPVLLPDVCIVAKPIGCGLPLGCIMANERAAASISPGMHGSTFGGSALACRVGIEFFDIMEEGLLRSVAEKGAYFRMRLEELAKKHTFIKEVRGVGLMIGVELTAPGKPIVADCMDKGLLLNCTHDVVLRFLPPYIVSEKEIDKAAGILAKAFKRFKPDAN